MAKSATFSHPVREVYIARDIESALSSGYFEKIKDKIKAIKETTRTPIIGEKEIIIIKDHTKTNDEDIAGVIEGWFAKEIHEGNKDYKELVELIKINLSWVN